MIVDERAFIERRKPDWDRLAEMLQRARFGLSKLPDNELKELGQLYRRSSSDLATARARSASPELVTHLNDLVGRAHGTIYSAERGSSLNIFSFLRREFPLLVRTHYPYVLTASLLFFSAFIFAFIYLSHSAGEGWLGQNMDSVGQKWLKDVEDPISLSSFIMTNNIKVAFLSFATGVTFGILTTLLLLYNGLMIGYIAAAVNTVGRGSELLAFVLPHGIIELTAIFIAGGAGLMMGVSLIRPGNFSRKDSLRAAARPAVRMIGGVIVMLIIAGIIEGFLSPSGLPNGVKVGVGGATALAVIIYFLGAGRFR